MNYLTLGEAIATRFSPAQMSPPTGLKALTGATATPPNAIANTPYIVVWPDAGQLVAGVQWMDGEADYNLELYYAKNEADQVRESRALQLWLGVLLAQMFTDGLALGLSPTVKKVLPISWEILPLPYAGTVYDGIRIGLRAFTGEAVTMTP